jgi:hypothetical protein
VTAAEVKAYLAQIGAKGGRAGRGKAKARPNTGAALRRYWRAVKAGKIKRAGVTALLFAVVSLLSCARETFTQPTNLATGHHAIIIGACGVIATNDYELAFGGCEGEPVRRVRMSPEEWEVVYRLIVRSEIDD